MSSRAPSWRSISAWAILASTVLCAGCSRAKTPPVIASPTLQSTLGGRVRFGDPGLTAGVPGDGPLTVAQTLAWLALPEVHEPLPMSLPVGLADAESLVVDNPEEPFTLAKIELGRQLFFDTRLSTNATFACATCHIPETHYSSNRATPKTGRNAPPTLNRVFGSEHFWDGRAKTLEQQPRISLENSLEMNTTVEACLERLRNVEAYRLQFERIYGGVRIEAVGAALAAFQRSLITQASPWDIQRRLRQLNATEGRLNDNEQTEREILMRLAEQRPMPAAASSGETLFFGDRARCGRCHLGPNLSDENYHNVGVGYRSPGELDPGRFGVTGNDADRGAFKTPTLRNIADTAPYMHDGSIATLVEVIDWFSAGGHPNPHLDAAIQPFDLTADERDDLVAFLQSLTGPLPIVETGRLPE